MTLAGLAAVLLTFLAKTDKAHKLLKVASRVAKVCFTAIASCGKAPPQGSGPACFVERSAAMGTGVGVCARRSESKAVGITGPIFRAKASRGRERLKTSRGFGSRAA